MIRRFLQWMFMTMMGWLLIVLTISGIYISLIKIAIRANRSGDMTQLMWMTIFAIIISFITYPSVKIIPWTLDKAGVDTATAARINGVMEKTWGCFFIILTLPLLFLSLFNIESLSLHGNKHMNSIVALTFVAIVCFTAYSIALGKKSLMIWRVYGIFGIWALLQIGALIKPIFFYNAFGIYPGADVYSKEIVAAKRAVAQSAKTLYEHDMLVGSENTAKTLEDFTKLCRSLNMTSADVLREKEFLCKQSAQNCAIIEAEEKRQDNLLQNRVRTFIEKAEVFRRKQVYTITYHPQEHGVGGIAVTIPFDTTNGYKVICEGQYVQEFTDRFESIGCNGYSGQPIFAPEKIRLMPIRNINRYGIVLIDNAILNQQSLHYQKELRININVPQEEAEYRAITGGLTLSFHKM